jgi:hypothetical protein
MDLCFCLAVKTQIFHSFLSKKKAPIKGPNVSLSRKSLQEFQFVDCTINQVGNGINAVLDLTVLR